MTIIAVHTHTMFGRWHEVTHPSFTDLGVAIEIVEALSARGITRPFPIQALTLPLALEGKDLIGQAQTGTGKTLSFVIPLLDRVFDDVSVSAPDGTPRALIVVPTRELCHQVTEDIELAAENLPLNSVRIYGGVSQEEQSDLLERKKADIVVGTPGRLRDLAQQELLDLSTVEIVVLDEADEMLDQGFLEDVRALLELTSEQRQTLLFSATLPGPIMGLTREFMHKPVRIQVDSTSVQSTHHTTQQIVFQAHWRDQLSILSRVLQTPGRGRTIIFATQKRLAHQLAENLAELGFRVTALHGDMKQPAREEALQAFRDATVDIIVATDVAARGIDIADVTHVINVNCPDNERTYVHRIGRTGRAGNSGVAVTLVDWEEVAQWNMIAQELDLTQHCDPPQWFSESPDFLETFDLPESLSDRVGEAREIVGSGVQVKKRGGANRSDNHRDNRNDGAHGSNAHGGSNHSGTNHGASNHRGAQQQKNTQKNAPRNAQKNTSKNAQKNKRSASSRHHR